MPVRQLATGFLQHPFAERHDQAAVFRRGNEMPRRDQAPLRALPAQQGFAADDAAARQVDQRLVVEQEFVALQGAAQVVVQVQPFLGVGIHAFGIEAEGIAAGGLGVVHRGIGLPQQRVEGVAVFRIDGDADRCRNFRFVRLDVEGFAQHRHHFRGDLGRHFGTVQIGQHHEEFVAAMAADRVGLAHARQQPLRGVAQQHVAHRMSVGVIDGLEAIEVHEQQRHLPAGAFAMRDRLFHAVLEQQAVGQAGQRIVVGEILDLRLGRLALADVGEYADEMGDPARAVAHR